MPTMLTRLITTAGIAVLMVGTGCTKIAINQMVPTIGQLAELGNEKTDLELMGAALPPNLLQLEGFLQLSPNNPQLLLLNAQVACGYAMGFVEHKDPARAGKYYLKGKDYGLRALANLNGDYEDAVEAGKPIREAVKEVDDLDHVPALFWAGNCWAGWLNNNMANPRAYFAVPDIIALLQRVIDLKDDYYYGGAHIFFGTYYASVPALAGGGLDKAYKHFERAWEITDHKFLMVDFMFAKSYATMLKDQEDPITGKTGEQLFDEAMARIESTPADVLPEAGLANAVAKEKARRLLEKKDRYF